MWDVDVASLRAAHAAVCSEQPSVTFVARVVDVQHASQISDAAYAAVAAAPPLSNWTIISNAGIVQPHDAHSTPVESLGTTFRVNVFPSWHLYAAFRAAFAVTPPAHACFILVSSLLSLLSSATLSSYCASKAGMNSLADCMRLELQRDAASQMYSVVTVLPYHVRNTRMFARGMVATTWLHAVRDALMPTIRDVDVAAAMLQAAHRRVHTVVFVPAITGWMWLAVSLLPLSWRLTVTGALGGWDGIPARPSADQKRAATEGESTSAAEDVVLASPSASLAARKSRRRASLHK